MYRNLIKSFAYLTAGITLFSCNLKEEEADHPNIIFIMSDDHAFQAVSAYGSGLNETPNIDRIAGEGAIFTRATVTNSLSAPSRAVILTGKHSFINGKVDNVQPYDWSQDNFPKLLQANGYQTALIGKIHLDGTPTGFDYSMVLPGQGHYYNPEFIVNGEHIRIEGYTTEIITEATIDWLQNKRNPDKPFCLLLQHKAPHRNWQPAPKYLNLYDHDNFAPPLNFFDDYDGRGAAAKEQEMEIARHMRWGHDFKFLVGPEGDSTDFINDLRRMTSQQKEEWMAAYESDNQQLLDNMPEGEELAHWKYNRFIKDYLRTIQSIDDGVGELLDYLDAEGLSGNTIVVYTSDQGFYLGEHGWFDKRFMYGESFRTPLLVRYPREISAGTEVKKLVQNLDFAPTLLDYAGVEIPDDMQGVSFRKLMANDTTFWRDAVYYTYYEYPSVHMVKRHYGVATERYKLMHFYYDIDEWEMYDLDVDPHEMNNVYHHPDYSNIRIMMHEKLEELRKMYGDNDELNQKYLETYMKQMDNGGQ